MDATLKRKKSREKKIRKNQKFHEKCFGRVGLAEKMLFLFIKLNSHLLHFEKRKVRSILFRPKSEAKNQRWRTKNVSPQKLRLQVYNNN